MKLFMGVLSIESLEMHVVVDNTYYYPSLKTLENGILVEARHDIKIKLYKSHSNISEETSV